MSIGVRLFAGYRAYSGKLLSVGLLKKPVCGRSVHTGIKGRQLQDGRLEWERSCPPAFDICPTEKLYLDFAGLFGLRPPMSEDDDIQRELIARMFCLITITAEDAAALATEGPPRERVVIAAPHVCRCCGSNRLCKPGDDITKTLEGVPRQWNVVQTCGRSSLAEPVERSPNRRRYSTSRLVDSSVPAFWRCCCSRSSARINRLTASVIAVPGKAWT